MKILEILAIVLIIMTSACKDKDGMTNPQPATLAEEIENIFQPMVDNNTAVGAAVGIIKPGGEKDLFFFGEKELNGNQSPDENTLFEIGSITKTMTATVLADMVLKGEVTLDDAVEDYLSEVESLPRYNDQKITFKHLANHTSSLPRLPDNLLDGNFDENQPYLNYTKEMMFDFLQGYTLPYAIGSVEEYSNLATGLLGYTLAEIKGKSLEALFQEIIFDRTGMTDACTVIAQNITNVAQPYDGELKAVPIWNMSEATLGAGGVKANMNDMLSFLAANMGHGNSDLIETLALTHENTQTLNDPLRVGLAWNNFFKAEDNTTLTWHNGGTAGTVSVMGFIKELDMGFVILFNSEIVDRTGEGLIELKKGVEILDVLKKY